MESLEISSQSYESAVALLKKAFASDISQKFESIKRLRDLKCTNKPYEFISEMRLVRDLFSTLSIDVETIMQFFVRQGLTSELQTQLITISNNNKPTLLEIEDNIFKAIDRSDEIKSKTNSCRPESVATDREEDKCINSFATRIDTKQGDKKFIPYCSLCSDRSGPKVTEHRTRDSPNYTSAKSKCDRLNALSACTLCGYANHETSNCRHKFA